MCKPTYDELEKLNRLYTAKINAYEILEAWQNDPCYLSSDWDKAHQAYIQAHETFLNCYREISMKYQGAVLKTKDGYEYDLEE